MRLLLLPLLACLVACGDDEAPATLQEQLTAQPGFWFEARPTTQQSTTARDLGQLGYAEGYVPAGSQAGVSIRDAERVQPGLNLYSSGHAPAAFLMNGEGRLLHRWGLPYDSIPGAPPMEHSTQAAWRRVRLLDDGSLLAIYEGLGLVQVDVDSNLVWHFPPAGPSPALPHHDLDLSTDGRILVLTRRPRILSRWNAKEAILVDSITELEADGTFRREVSLIDCLQNSRWSSRLAEVAREGGDVLHTNSLEILDGTLADRDPAFAQGNVLVCFRELDAIAVVDLEAARVVWMSEGGWAAPHDPTLLANGRMLLFDNMGHAGYSRVLEFEPLTGEVTWSYEGSPPESFFSVFCGASARMANGNTLITETCYGRALEVTPAGEVVWSFHSPHRAGEQKQLVAALYEVQRLAPESPLAWLER